MYTKAGDAIKKANDYNGVVVDSSQDYVWERGNRNLQYSITEKDDVLNTIKDRLKNQEKPIDILKDINDGVAYDLTDVRQKRSCTLSIRADRSLQCWIRRMRLFWWDIVIRMLCMKT